VNLRYPYAALGMSMLALALAGCGSGGSSTAATTEGPSIPFGSPAVTAARLIPGHYKCSNRAVWLPLKWGALPAKTQELALYTVRFGPPKVVSGGKVKAEVKAESLVLGLRPTLRQLRRGKFPHGALVAVHSRRGEVLSICPRKGVAENLLFRIYALRHKLHLSKSSRVNPLQEVTNGAIEAGTFIARYKPA
jgi:hypothetical protein